MPNRSGHLGVVAACYVRSGERRRESLACLAAIDPSICGTPEYAEPRGAASLDVRMASLGTPDLQEGR